MIARYWKGIVKSEMADDYVQHLQEDTLALIKTLEGFRSATVLRNDMPEGVEFVVITDWDSLDSIKRFAGEDVDQAVVPDKAAAMMITCDDKVKHYEVVEKLKNN